MRIFNLLIVMAGIMIMAGCTDSNKTIIDMASTPSAPDYSVDTSWVAKPVVKEKAVDVFYVYPTIYVGSEPQNMDTSDPKLRANAKGLLRAQAGVYSPYANLFTPFYRQQTAATQSMEPNNGGRNAFVDPLFRTGYRDVERAFDYYIENLNDGRPFILAGHSQGSMVVIELLRRRLNNPELHKRMIAAYPIGYSVIEHDLEKYPWIRLARGETDTGVVITFNTQGPEAVGSPVLLKNAVAINPLNWKTDGTAAPRGLNIKARFFNDATGELIETVDNFAGAYIDTDTGALIATDIQTPESDKIDLVNMGRWPKQVYHRYDYAFWYDNIKENVKKRIDAFLAQEAR
jgi:pimeloyl-ACP methyl ester carboxylesterase